MKSMVCPRCKGKLVTEDGEVYDCPYCDYQEIDFEVRNRRLELEAEKQREEDARLAKLQREKDERRLQRTDPSGNTLIVHYTTNNPGVNMVVRLADSRQKDIMTNGQTLKFRLAPGQHVIVLKIGKINHNKTFIVPKSKEYVEINASWTGRPSIIVDQPEIEEELMAAQPAAAGNQQAPSAAPVSAQAPAAAKPEKSWEDMSLMERMFRKGTIPQWIIAGVLLLCALVYFKYSPIGAILVILGAAVISPALTEFLGEILSDKLRIPIKVACFVVGGIFALIGIILAGNKMSGTRTNPYSSYLTSTSEKTSEVGEPAKAVTSVEIDDLTGMVLSKAIEKLTEAGCSNIVWEPRAEILLPDNWIITKQSVEAGKKINSDEEIQLDCQKLDDYFTDNYVGKTLAEAEKMASEEGFKVAYLNEKNKSLIGKVGTMDDAEKEKWTVKSASQDKWKVETTVSLVIVNESGEESDDVDEPEEVKEAESEETKEDTEKEALNQKEIRPDVKEAIDSYEAFMDEYLDFMKKYQTANTTELLMDYMDWMGKYADMTEKMEKMEGDLTEAEAMYYAEVTARVSAKMLQFSLTQ